MGKPFTDEDWNTLLGHIGYGNPRGALWFLGMEEALGGDRDANLRWRLDHFAHPVDTLTNHMKAPWIGGTVPRTPTWRIMAKIARLLEGANDWAAPEAAATYVRRKPGTATGSTFLMEMLPLPNKSLKDWSHHDRFPGGRLHYERDHLTQRIEQLREFVNEYQPRCIICYGKGFWPRYHQVMPLTDVRSIQLPETTVTIGRWNTTTVLHTPFFVPYAFPERAIAAIPGLLREYACDDTKSATR